MQEVAEVLQVKPSTVSYWTAQKRIPFIKFGEGKKSLVRFSPKKLNQWLDEMSHDPEGENESPTKPSKMKKARQKTIERFNQFAAEI
ncbi:MAG: helix-turn-helix domain-containing protein [Candidatus Aminicenantes bacterium]